MRANSATLAFALPASILYRRFPGEVGSDTKDQEAQMEHVTCKQVMPPITSGTAACISSAIYAGAGTSFYLVQLPVFQGAQHNHENPMCILLVGDLEGGIDPLDFGQQLPRSVRSDATPRGETIAVDTENGKQDCQIR